MQIDTITNYKSLHTLYYLVGTYNRLPVTNFVLHKLLHKYGSICYTRLGSNYNILICYVPTIKKKNKYYLSIEHLNYNEMYLAIRAYEKISEKRINRRNNYIPCVSKRQKHG